MDGSTTCCSLATVATFGLNGAVLVTLLAQGSAWFQKYKRVAHGSSEWMDSYFSLPILRRESPSYHFIVSLYFVGNQHPMQA